MKHVSRKYCEKKLKTTTAPNRAILRVICTHIVFQRGYSLYSRAIYSRVQNHPCNYGKLEASVRSFQILTSSSIYYGASHEGFESDGAATPK